MIRHLAALRRARCRSKGRLSTLPNVVGTGIGFKVVQGQALRTPAVVVFVEKKVAKAELSPEERIPGGLEDQRRLFTTDVVEVERPVRQVGGPPFFCLDDGGSQGTVTCLARLRSPGSSYALTCAHCVEGRDQDLTTPCDMQLWNPALKTWVKAGVFSPPFYGYLGGDGLPGDFGFADWSLFSVSDPDVVRRAESGRDLVCGSVQAGQQVAADAAGDRRLSGEVRYVESDMYGVRADVMVALTGAQTVEGDSGLLWRDPQGRAVSMHALWIQGFSLGMGARRLSNILARAGVDLVDPYP